MAKIYFDTTASGANDGSSWADAYETFAALNAHVTSEGDEVVVANKEHDVSSFYTLGSTNDVLKNAAPFILRGENTTDTPSGGTLARPIINYGTNPYLIYIGATTIQDLVFKTTYSGITSIPSLIGLDGDNIENHYVTNCTFIDLNSVLTGVLVGSAGSIGSPPNFMIDKCGFYGWKNVVLNTNYSGVVFFLTNCAFLVTTISSDIMSANDGVSMKNCIISDPNDYLDAITGGTFTDQGGNYMYRPAGTLNGLTDLGDPKFVAPSDGDFRLKPNSPLLGQGVY